jgi:signal transduction histidine kinase/ActR/RegA family two-component response regulator
VSKSSPIARGLDALIPASVPPAGPARHTARFLTGAVVLAQVVSWVTGGTLALAGLTMPAALTLAYGPLVAMSLLLLRAGVSSAVALHVALLVTSTYFVVNTLAQQPLDVSQLFWFALVPLCALWTLGRRAGMAWGLVSMVAVALTLLAFALGWSHGQPATEPLWAAASRLLNFLAATVLLGLLFDDARLRAQQELEHARDEAERASQAKTQFLANVSHELRTPMNAVVGVTDALLTEPLTVSQRSQLQLIHTSGQAMVALIGDLLDVAKIEAGQLTLEAAPMDPARVAREVAELFEASARAKDLELRVEIPPTLPTVLGDPLRLRQALANLVGNAIKFTERGHVRLWARASGDEGDLRDARVTLELGVEDTGIGIPTEARARLFEKFFQVDPSHTRRFGGTGLGLAITRELIARMGGELRLDSELGRGTTVTLKVPMTRAAPRLPSSGEHRALPTLAPGKAVLVVDDNVVNLKVASLLLSRLGVQVETAAGGEEAVRRFEPGKYRAILMDLHMPEVDGYQATRRIRALESGERTPIVALTASALSSELEECREAGMDDHLIKPVTLQQLATALAAHEGPATGEPS